jgi:hypothetical protein
MVPPKACPSLQVVELLQQGRPPHELLGALVQFEPFRST